MQQKKDQGDLCLPNIVFYYQAAHAAVESTKQVLLGVGTIWFISTSIRVGLKHGIHLI